MLPRVMADTAKRIFRAEKGQNGSEAHLTEALFTRAQLTARSTRPQNRVHQILARSNGMKTAPSHLADISDPAPQATLSRDAEIAKDAAMLLTSQNS